MTNRGVTLVELMIVVAIIGAVATMGGYALRPPVSFARERADMYAALTQARNMAAMRGECAVAEVKGQTLSISTYATTTQNCAGPFTDPPARTAPSVTFAGDVVISTFSNGAQRIIFNTTGGLTPDKLVTFTLTNGLGGQSNFRVYPAIGQIRVQ